MTFGFFVPSLAADQIDQPSAVRQALLIAIASLAFGAVILVLARKRLLSLRYTVGWHAVALLGLLAATLTGLVGSAARALGVTPTALFAMAASAVLLAIAVQLSISVSGLQRQVRQLAEAHALLAEEVEPGAQRPTG